jgi:hypothetical protein
MRKTTIYFLLVLLVAVPRLSAASEPFDFVSDVIESLEACKIAGERIKDSASEDPVTIMKDITVFNNGIRRANLMVARHQNSKVELIRESTAWFSSIYLSIVKNNEQLLSFLEQTLNDPKEATSKQGTWLRKLSENMATNEEGWKQLPYAIAMTTHTLVDRKRMEDGKLKFLTITKIERERLRSQLQDAFSDQVRSGAKAGQLPVDYSAALLWEFLAQEWNPAATK